ncbi:unnamed protein product [Calicophoron daubneyi]|uniref:Uncharacterized protein n=1 Tax=Calicophoron daubneyi TaxID=300641 RepID=A0AAV2T467_CALDB
MRNVSSTYSLVTHICRYNTAREFPVLQWIPTSSKILTFQTNELYNGDIQLIVESLVVRLQVHLGFVYHGIQVRVHPNGRLLQYSYPQGHTSYWFHRLKVEIKFVSCEDFLVLGLIPEDITQPNLQPEEASLTAHEPSQYL